LIQKTQVAEIAYIDCTSKASDHFDTVLFSQQSAQPVSSVLHQRALWLGADIVTGERNLQAMTILFSELRFPPGLDVGGFLATQ
jgi:hypothetical protein